MGTVDWNKIVQDAEEGPQPVPDGPYNAYVESAEGKLSQNGSPMVVAVFKIADGPYAGKVIWNNFVLSPDKPAALGYFLAHMGVLGVSQQQIMQLPQDEMLAMQTLAPLIVGKWAALDVGHRVWNGKVYNQVNDLKPYGGQVAAAPAPVAAPPSGVVQPSVTAPAAQPVQPSVTAPAAEAVAGVEPGVTYVENAPAVVAPPVAPDAGTPQPPPAPPF
jgi:hypothetical protein